MATTSASSHRAYRVPASALAPYLMIAFGLAWGVFALLILQTERVVALFGPISAANPLFILAVYAPGIAAFSLVAWHGGAEGLRRFLGRVLLWRAPWPWIALLLFGLPAIYLAGSAVKGNLLPNPVNWQGLGPTLGAMAFMLVLGPMEEFGWRGLALPILQRRMAPLWAGLLLGFIWGLWHLPAFFLSGTPQSAWGFTPFLAGSIAVSVILTPLFNATRGSILYAALFHFQLNNPLWPDAQPWDTWFFVAAAILTVWFNRDTMLTRGGGVTAVIPPD